jgi:nucleotide-binding universal stress UspA family protein
MAEAREENALLSKQLARFAKQYPQVPIHEHYFSGQPADCLLGHAQHAPPAERPQLIVVGSRGRGVLSGLFLGSTSHSVIAHAACPVVVVRPISI